jgi:hypothetical protein
LNGPKVSAIQNCLMKLDINSEDLQDLILATLHMKNMSGNKMEQMNQILG